VNDLYFEKLQEIANGFPKTSLEYSAVLIASKALLFVSEESEFKIFCDQFDEPLTADQVAHLKSMGIDSMENKPEKP